MAMALTEERAAPEDLLLEDDPLEEEEGAEPVVDAALPVPLLAGVVAVLVGPPALSEPLSVTAVFSQLGRKR